MAELRESGMTEERRTGEEIRASRKEQLKKINLSGDHWLSIDEIPGMYCRGIQYFDFKKVVFINYNGLAHLIKFFKFFLEKGIEVHLVNVNEPIKNKIRSMGLDHILNCR